MTPPRPDPRPALELDDRCDCCGARDECDCEIALEPHEEEMIRDERGVVTRSVEIVVCRTHRCEVEPLYRRTP